MWAFKSKRRAYSVSSSYTGDAISVQNTPYWGKEGLWRGHPNGVCHRPLIDSPSKISCDHRAAAIKDHSDGPPADPRRLRSRQLPGVGASCPQEPCSPCLAKTSLPAPLTPVCTASPDAPSSAKGS